MTENEMSDEQEDIVAKAEALMANVTPWAWAWEELNGTEGLSLGNDEAFVIQAQHMDEWSCTIDVKDADAAFIAAAPQLVRDLVAEVKRLRGDNPADDLGNLR
jgi:hypothetical protein